MDAVRDTYDPALSLVLKTTTISERRRIHKRNDDSQLIHMQLPSINHGPLFDSVILQYTLFFRKYAWRFCVPNSDNIDTIRPSNLLNNRGKFLLCIQTKKELRRSLWAQKFDPQSLHHTMIEASERHFFSHIVFPCLRPPPDPIHSSIHHFQPLPNFSVLTNFWQSYDRKTVKKSGYLP